MTVKDEIAQFNGDDEQLLNALRHMLTRPNLSMVDKVVVKEAAETIEGLIDQLREVSEYE